MRTFIISLLTILIMNQANAQSEKTAYKTVADQFQSFYNEGKYDNIFAMFDDNMKKALPLDKTSAFLQGLHLQAGKINGKEFQRYVNGSYASYKTTFEKVVFDLNISIDGESKINGLFVKPFVDDNSPKLVRNSTKMILPFKDVWTVIWGGDTKEQNYHVETRSQKNAFDIVVSGSDGRSYKTNGQSNDDYYAFGKEITAPCDGEVVFSVDGVKDNKPGVMNPIYVPGNSVMIKTVNNEFLLFAHFKNQSVAVKQGEKVKQGQLLGRCGNSGNSSEPHLHFHIQNVEDMIAATGVPCFFEKIKVNGHIKMDYSPVKGDKISNE